MRRKPCSSTWKRTHAAGLCLSVFFSVFSHVLFITPPSAYAEERSPFDPVFAPATGQGLENIAIPLNRRINETFIRGRVPSNAVAESPDPDIREPEAVPVQPTPVQPVASETTSPPQNTRSSSSSSSRNGLITDLLRLFGFNANDSTDTADKAKTTERDTEQGTGGLSEEPPAAQLPESPVAPEVPYDVQETEPEPEPELESEPETQEVALSSPSDNPGFLQQITTWFAENTERIGVPDEGSYKTHSVSIDLPPPLEVTEPVPSKITEPDTVKVTKTEQIIPKPEIKNAAVAARLQSIPQTNMEPGHEVPAQRPARVVEREALQQLDDQTAIAPDPPITTTSVANTEADMVQPVAQPVAQPVVQPVTQPVAQPVAQPEETSVDSGFFSQLLGLSRETPDTLSAATRSPEPAEVIDTVEIAPEPVAASPVEQPVEQPVEEPIQAITRETVAVPESAPGSSPEPEPSLQIASLAPIKPPSVPEIPPDVRVPTIKRKGLEPNFADVVSSFFSGDTVERQQRVGDEAPKRKQTELSARPAEGEDTPVAVRRSVGVSEPSPAPTEPQPTPLVDAAIAEAQGRNIDPATDTAFAVDIAVPVSDTVRIIEEKLILGFEGNLGRALPFGDDPGEHCLRRLSGRTWICLESLGWPSVIADAFMARGVPEGRTKAIVRYDAEQATQYRVSFPAESFDRIRFHFEYLLGPPNDVPEVWVPLFAEPKRKNRVIRWVAEKVGDKPPAVLEMREIDDIRWMESPDKTNGVVRLYRDGAKPIFSMIMTADLRLIEVRRIGNKDDKVKFPTAP